MGKIEKFVEAAFAVALAAVVLALQVLAIAVALEFTDWLMVTEFRTIVLFILGITIYQVFKSSHTLVTLHKKE